MTAERTFQEIDHSFRQSYGQIVSRLMSKFGALHVEEIENAVMESYYQALKIWPLDGLPQNPTGWLYTVSKNKMLDLVRSAGFKRKSSLEQKQEEGSMPTLSMAIDDIEEDGLDPELKLLFLVCHPALSEMDRLAFMLKLISGFGIREIASALLTREETIKKRLVRARKTIRKKQIAFEWPDQNELNNRLTYVHTALYLLFNEGYYSSHPDRWVRKEFCVEAMRLCKYMIDQNLVNHDTYALMALMCFHSSRFEGRIDQNDDLVLLRYQDRSLWNNDLKEMGGYFIYQSIQLADVKSIYQLEAVISAVHSSAKSFEKTNWLHLDDLYQVLSARKNTPIVKLNRIIVKIELNDLDVAKQHFEELNVEDFKTQKSIYYLVGAELYKKLQNQMHSRALIERALTETHSDKERQLLEKRLEQLN